MAIAFLPDTSYVSFYIRRSAAALGRRRWLAERSIVMALSDFFCSYRHSQVIVV